MFGANGYFVFLRQHVKKTLSHYLSRYANTILQIKSLFSTKKLKKIEKNKKNSKNALFFEFFLQFLINFFLFFENIMQYFRPFLVGQKVQDFGF